jgi:tRNA 5-methylaminomethyl-2-thiouridine biosynthesis bifunctional protein
MKTQPIRPARITFDDGVPFAHEFGDVYHARAGAQAQAEHVFLRGNGLPGRWAGSARFAIIETGFGLGNNFLATWAAWRADARRCDRLFFISVERHPPERGALQRAHRSSPQGPLADQLIEAWPPLTHNLHALDFEAGRVRLMLAFGDVADWLPELVCEADAFYLDGFAPAKNPQMWDRRVFKALARMAVPDATASTWSVARTVRDGLAEAGFAVERAPGFASKGDMTVARYAPAFIPRRAPSRLAHRPGGAREALVIGAGLAGACAAAALQDEGFHCTVIDRHPHPAAETSGNPAGLFHGIVTPEDGAHARFNRAAALQARRSFAPLIADGTVGGQLDGLLRLHPGADVAELQGLLHRLGLPPDFVQALDAPQATAAAGAPVASPAWLYPGGGWLSPAQLAAWCSQASAYVGGRTVQSLRGTAAGWCALDADGRAIACAPVLVVANAADALRLLGRPAWPVRRVRGQVTLLDAPLRLQRPLAGAGYAIDLQDGRLLCGATSQPDDPDSATREEDHRANLAQLGRLLGRSAEGWTPLEGRVGFRTVCSDRLPVLGPVPAEAAGPARLDQPRFVPRRPGLHVMTALGSRGITWAPLAARTLAAWIAGSPLPLEASLVDAVDAARFASRAARQERGSSQPPPSAR